MSFPAKQLFPSAGPSQEATEQNSEAFTSAPSASAPSSSGSGKRLDWLENKSFNTEVATVIAKLHANISDEQVKERGEENSKSISVLQSQEEYISRKRHRHHDEDRQRSHKKHKSDKSRHRHSTKYNSDSDDSLRRHHHSKKKKKKHKKHKHGSSRSHRHSSSSSDESPDDKRSTIPRATWLDELGHSTTETHYLDNKPDKNNLCFDSLHFTDTAFYDRLGRSCLGLSKEKQKISWRHESKEKQSKKQSSRSNSDRYFGKGRLSYREEDVEVVANASKQSDSISMNRTSASPAQSYIALKSEATKSNSNPLDPLGVYDVSTNQYLISGLQQLDSSSSSKQENVNQEEDRTFLASKQVSEFNKYLHDNPSDIKKWLEFVKFQDTVEALQAFSVEDSGIDKRKKQKMFILEKKQSILEKALKLNPNNIELQLAELELNRERWSEPELVKQWEKVLKSHPDDMALWREYILFNQSMFSTFTVAKAVELYGKCFEALQSEVENISESSGESQSVLTDEMMEMFIQQCQLWKQSGHTEKAVAAFQAMVELNCYCPDHLQHNTKLKGQVAFLETFWDSDEARFGEKGAKGWEAWMTKKEKGGWVDPPPENEASTQDDDESSQSLDSSKPMWQLWIQEELHREQTHLLPWRPDVSKGETEEDCEDPERMVLFDDISSILFKVHSEQERFNLILHFLDFLGVNTMFHSTCSGQQTIYNTILEHPEQVFADANHTSGVHHTTHNPDEGCILHSNGVAFNCSSLDSRTGVICKELHDLVMNVFTQSIALFKEPVRTNLKVMWLQHELSSVATQQKTDKQQKKRVKAARKFAKKLLSEEENRNNLLLWEVFAKWEWSLGNKIDACKMLDMGLSFAKQLTDPHNTRTAAQVVSTYTMLLCSDGDNKDTNHGALYILTNYVESSKYVPYQSSHPVIPSVAIIRARKLYQEQLESAMKGYKASCEAQKWLQSSGSYIVHFARCYARFQYLTVGMQAASVVLEETLNCVKRCGQTCPSGLSRMQQKVDYELVMTSYTTLVAQHVLSHPLPLSTLRNLLRRALSEFPDNANFIQLFVSVEAKSHIAGTVRRYFDHAIQEANSPIPWLCAINAERQRQQMISTKAAGSSAETTNLPETGVSNHIRSLFDRAVTHKTSRHCILLWRLYMQFEVDQGNTKRAQAIFYQALQHCPWAKVLYIDAVRYFPEKLQDFHDLLMEKELRIRAPIEEIELLVQG